MAAIETQAFNPELMGQDIALCALLETLARVQPALAKAVAEDIRAKAAHLHNSSSSVTAETSRKAIAYAEILERTARGENPGKENAQLNALAGHPH